MDKDEIRDNNLLIMKKAGINESQAKVYLALLEHGELSPVKLAKITGETRTNAYMICEKLLKLGLIRKIDGRKTTYSANHPVALEVLAEKRRKILTRNEQEVKQGVGNLIDLYYAQSERPSAKTLQGEEGIKEIFNDIIRTKKDTFLVRSQFDKKLDRKFLRNYREKRQALGINTYAITIDTENGRKHILEGRDQETLFHRTIIDKKRYTAPVEIDVYGDKTAFVSFGETQTSFIISSPAIAEAMRQICQIIIEDNRAYSDSIIAGIKRSR
ncbi:MAG: TrmB family transcriptional regulator [Candidatus Nanosyncoccaceae bacterium]|jgi:sugar-specific transcriptional regulator TrmB